MSALTLLASAWRSVVYNGAHLVPFVPTPVKAAFLLLLIFQFPTFPLSWHIGVFKKWTIVAQRIRFSGRQKYLDEWLANIQKAGTIRNFRHRITKRATPGQCDFNMHLSNSSYALNADRARAEWLLEAMGPFLTFKTGSYPAIGASHFVYIKEIPIMSRYVMETRISGYGDKWIYGVVEYIIYPKHKSGAGDKLVQGVKEKLDNESLKAATMSATTSGAATPLEKVKVAATLRASAPRDDGGVVACIAIFEACFKIGRITIPPRIALHYSMQSPDPAAREHARKICLSKDGGKQWLRGGWRDEPNADSLGLEIGPEGGEGNGEWCKRANEGMVAMNEGLARSV